MLHRAAVKTSLEEPRASFLDMLRLMQGFGTEMVHLVHVTAGTSAELKRNSARLEELATQVRDLGFTVKTITERGAPARRNAYIAHDLGVDYLALYWMPKPLLVQALMGSIDGDIVRLCDLPVLVYNRSLMQASTSLKRIVYATGFQATDARVMPYLKSRELEAEELFILNVGERAPDPVAEHARQRCVQQNLERLAAECESVYASVVPMQVIGSRRVQILRQASRLDADLIVVGKRDNPTPVRRLLGSLAEALTRKSRRSVFIIPDTLRNQAL